DGADGDFVPAERRGNERLGSACSKSVRRRGVSPDAVLGDIDCHMVATMCRTVRLGDERGESGGKLLGHRPDPTAYFEIGISRGQWYIDVDAMATAGLGVACETCLFQMLAQP